MESLTLERIWDGVENTLFGIRLVIKNTSIYNGRFLWIFISLSLLSVIFLCVIQSIMIIPLLVLQGLMWVASGGESVDTNEALSGVMRLIREFISFFPFMALLFIRYVYPKPLDDIFMESLIYVDKCHPGRPPYATALSKERYRINYWKNKEEFSDRVRAKLRLFTLGFFVFFGSLLPKVGPLVLPIAGVYAGINSLGNMQGLAVGICFFFIPRSTTMSLLHALVVMRALMRQMFDPYFARMDMNHNDRRRWLARRKDVLFAFSAMTYFLTHAPYISFIGYGIAQATAAYMLTTVVDVPQPLADSPKQTVDDLSISESAIDRKNK